MAQIRAVVDTAEDAFDAEKDAVIALEAAPAPQPVAANESMAEEKAGTAAPNASRRKAGRIALLLVGILGLCIAWYPLSDHHAPFAGGASVIADVTQISARVGGPVTQVAISDNAEVRAGQVLFRIDDTPYAMDVEQARAQLAQVLNSVGSSFAAIPAAEAKLEQARLALETAEDDLARARQLHEKELIAPAKLSQAEAGQRSSMLNVQAAEAEVERLRVVAGAVDADNPNVRTAQAALEKAEFALASTS
uniref:HlyD family secretion protein n=1 Tax=Devosia sp. TaxID=1871048 RepID=UPI002AFFDB00